MPTAKDRCMFSGEIADSVEHVIPKWLQRRFKLWNQTVVLPNGTSLPYRQLTVPVSSAHNAKFSAIEGRIARGEHVPHEIYLWALKIHIGFIYRDATLKAVRDDPTSQTIFDLSDFRSEIMLFRQLYIVWSSGLTTDPSPFGTVHALEAQLPDGDFDLFHCLITGTVGVRVGEYFIVAFLWDQGDGYRSNIASQWLNHHLASVRQAPPEERHAVGYLSHHVWACEAAYFLWRHRRPIRGIRTKGGLILDRTLPSKANRPLDETVYRRICAGFALNLEEFNGESHNRYSQSRPPDPKTKRAVRR